MFRGDVHTVLVDAASPGVGHVTVAHNDGWKTEADEAFSSAKAAEPVAPALNNRVQADPNIASNVMAPVRGHASDIARLPLVELEDLQDALGEL